MDTDRHKFKYTEGKIYRGMGHGLTQMDTDRHKFKYTELTDKVIQAFYKVYNTLGYGFLEKVYENALMIELDKMGISAKAQSPIKVLYEDKIIGEYFADILVQDCVIVEIKAANGIIPEHKAQLLNYLKATNIEVGLLVNFGPKPEIKRKVFDNWRKGNGTRIDTETAD